MTAKEVQHFIAAHTFTKGLTLPDLKWITEGGWSGSAFNSLNQADLQAYSKIDKPGLQRDILLCRQPDRIDAKTVRKAFSVSFFQNMNKYD